MVLESASRFLFSLFRFLGDWSSRVAQVRREFPVFHLPGTSEREARALPGLASGPFVVWFDFYFIFDTVSLCSQAGLETHYVA